MQFYLHSRDAEMCGDDPWRPVYVMNRTPVREVIERIAGVADEDILLDSRGIPQCDLVTERIRDVTDRYWKISPINRKADWPAKRAERVNLPFAFAANLLAEDVPLFNGGKLYLQKVHMEVIGKQLKSTAVRMSIDTPSWYNHSNYGHEDQWYTCNTTTVLPDGSVPSAKRAKHEPMSEEAKKQAEDDADLCQLALAELDRRDFKGVAVFDANGKFTGLKQWYSCNDDDDDYNELRKEVAVKEFDSDDENDPAATHIRIPSDLFKGMFPKCPETVVTIGDGRALYDGKMEPFWVLQPIDGEGAELFKASDLYFQPGFVMYEEMHNPYIDDDTEFTWGGTGRYFIKITPHLLAWSRNVIATVELLSNAKHWETIKDFNARLKNQVFPDDVVMWLKAQRQELREKEKALPSDCDSVAYKEMQLKFMPLSQKIRAMEDQWTARIELAKVKILKEWREECARMLATDRACAGNMKQTKLRASSAPYRHGALE